MLTRHIIQEGKCRKRMGKLGKRSSEVRRVWAAAGVSKAAYTAPSHSVGTSVRDGAVGISRFLNVRGSCAS